MEIKNVEELFEEVPISGSITLKNLLVYDNALRSLKYSDVTITLAKLLFNSDNHAARLTCVECKDKSVFAFEVYELFSKGSSLEALMDNGVELNFRKFPSDSKHEQSALLDGSCLILSFIFTCKKNPNHLYHMVLQIEIVSQKEGKNKDLKITKIGQTPEPYLLKRSSFEYDRALEEFGGNQDYWTAMRCYYTGLYSGACAYLRRTYEKLIDQRLLAKGYDPKAKEKKKLKIDKIKDTFDPDIQGQLLTEYKALSAGVHSLSEEDCGKYYLSLKDLIDIELENIDHLRKKKQRVKGSSDAHSEIIDKVS